MVVNDPILDILLHASTGIPLLLTSNNVRSAGSLWKARGVIRRSDGPQQGCKGNKNKLGRGDERPFGHVLPDTHNIEAGSMMWEPVC